MTARLESPEYVRGYLDGLGAAEAGTRPRDYLAGWSDRARLERECVEVEWAAVRDVVARTAAVPSFAELCERRGEPHRAGRQRELLRANGVVA